MCRRFGDRPPAEAGRPYCLGQSHSSVRICVSPAGMRARSRSRIIRPCTCCRTGLQACSSPASSDPVDLRHPKHSTYGCFLPDLTRFMALRRAGPDRQRRLTRTVPSEPALEQGFNPAIADCGFRAPLAPRLARPKATVRDRLERRSIGVAATSGFRSRFATATSRSPAFTRCPTSTGTASTLPGGR